MAFGRKNTTTIKAQLSAKQAELVTKHADHLDAVEYHQSAAIASQQNADITAKHESAVAKAITVLDDAGVEV